MSQPIELLTFTESANIKDCTFVIIPKEHWPRFQELVQRGTNLWPDAHPEIKRLADLVTTGQVQQDYDHYSNSHA